MNIIKGLNSALAFVLELAMLAGFGYWGFQTAASAGMKVLLGLGLPIIALLLWGVFFAPRSSRRLSLIPGVLLSLGLFWLSAAALYAAQQQQPGLIFAIVAVINRALVVIWRQW